MNERRCTVDLRRSCRTYDFRHPEVNGQDVYVARYLDWLVTTPLLLATLAFTAMFYAERKHVSLVATLIGADVVMILSGLFADLTAREAVRWLWYDIGCGCLAVIVYIAWGALRRIAYAGDEEHRSFRARSGYPRPLSRASAPRPFCRSPWTSEGLLVWTGHALTRDLPERFYASMTSGPARRRALASSGGTPASTTTIATSPTGTIR